MGPAAPARAPLLRGCGARRGGRRELLRVRADAFASAAVADAAVAACLEGRRGGGTTQVVLLCGNAAAAAAGRAARLSWPAGTFLWEVASDAAHAASQDALQAAPLPYGTALKRVSSETGLGAGAEDWAASLELQIDFHPERPSLWVVEGASGLGPEGWDAAIAAAADLAATGSEFVGVVPSAEFGSADLVRRILASHGLLASVAPLEDVAAELGVDCRPDEAGFVAIRATKQRPSNAEIAAYERAVEIALSEADEDGWDD